MNIPQTYNYLVRARRDLWASLEAAPNEVLSRPLLGGSRFHCIKDLVFHIANVEDSWLHLDILRVDPVLEAFAPLREAGDRPVYAGFALGVLLDYWRAVEQRTLSYLADLPDDGPSRVVTVEGAPHERYTVDGLLWHVMIHEMRHTAQIAVLLRTQGIKPPSLDLLFYLPPA
ncbi:putative damage-inducible protein DinB [Deinobacterium chartae]|uniref:Putative damage-inducible protein DinB n=1 Tax=Deinobacterium chartae TaxID=521158 RepID=A0A841I7C9_9DEIO|nr:DinB family protein [Deinobacterium chartae]MBB6100119.1 putative damage-inducible protein DinB [Deinobacterium chartae]